MANDLAEKPQTTKVRTYTFKPNNTRTTIVLGLFWLFIIINAVIPLIGMYGISKYNTALREQTDVARAAFMSIAEHYDTASMWAGVIFIACAIAFLFWLYRASVNTHALNSKTKIEFSPAWSVGSYFIPVLNLYWPYKAMKELWIINVTSSETGIVLGWWITYLIFNFTTSLASKLSEMNHIDLPQFVLLDSISDIVGVISAVLAVQIIKKINEGQMGKSQIVVTPEPEENVEVIRS